MSKTTRIRLMVVAGAAGLLVEVVLLIVGFGELGGQVRALSRLAQDKEEKTPALPRGAAKAFAKKVLEAIEAIREDSLEDPGAGRLVAWGIEELYAHAKAKVPESIAKRLKNAPTMKAGQLEELLTDARLALGKRKGLDNPVDLGITLDRMLRRLDPDSEYIPPEKKIPFSFGEGTPLDIGARFAMDPRTNQLLIVTPRKGGPAHKAWLYAGDVIVAVTSTTDSDGKRLAKPRKVLTKGRRLDEAIALVQNQNAPKVILTVQRQGRKKPFDVTVATDGHPSIEEPVLGVRRKKGDEWDYFVDPAGNLAYLRLPRFYPNSFRGLEATMKELLKQGVKGVVLDLRFNPGGRLDEAIKVADLFIDDGLIVRFQPRDPKKGVDFKGKHAGSLLGFPMVCLINGESARNSELVAAALQDHKRAFVIGERSKGRAGIQGIRDFDVIDPATGAERKAEIKITFAEFVRPNGQGLHRTLARGREDDRWGVMPDKVVKLTAKEQQDLHEWLQRLELIEQPPRRPKAPWKDSQLDAALEYLRGKIKADGKTR
jgi:carboxyl-terminal processing protease